MMCREMVPSLDPSDLYVLALFQGLTITRELQPNGLHPNANDAGEGACNKPEAQAKPIVPPSAAPSRPVNLGLGDLVLIATCLYSQVW